MTDQTAEPRRLVIPTGPLKDPPRGVLVADPTGERNLTKICLAAIKACLAEVDFGEHDEAILEWLAFTCDVGDVATICSIIVRAQTNRLARLAEVERERDALRTELAAVVALDVDLRDRAAADGITPAGIRAYLQALDGWELQETREPFEAWAPTSVSAERITEIMLKRGTQGRAMLPLTEAIPDYQRYVVVFIRDVAALRGIPALTVMRDLRIASGTRPHSGADLEGGHDA